MAGQGSTPRARLKVFISYTRESSVHDERVANLARRIVSELAFDCDIDQFHSNQNWPQWMERKLDWADRVLVIATPTYHRRWTGKEPDGLGLGAKWESLLTRQQLYEAEGNTSKFVPVIFSASHVKYIPTPLRGYSRVLFTPGGELGLLRSRLLDIPPVSKPSFPVVSTLPKLDEQYFPGFASPSGPNPLLRLYDAERFDRSSLGIAAEQEELVSNLFPVDFPTTLYQATLPKRIGFKEFAADVERIWKNVGSTLPPPRDYVLDGKTVYRFKPFTEEHWLLMAKLQRFVNISNIASTTWAHSSVFSETGNFIKLLNSSLTELCRTHDMDYSKDLRCHLFIHRGTQHRVLRVKSLTNYGTRELCKVIHDKNSTDPNAILHYQHQAFRHQFKRFGREWYLVITPFWAFTSDGKVTKSRLQKSWSSKARKPERNRSVLGHILLWKAVFCREEDMLRQSSGFRVRNPISLNVNPSVVDREWVNLSRDDERSVLEAANE